MKTLIFGSTALKHWFPDFPREPNDLDYIGKRTSSRGIEYHWAPSFQYILDNNKDETFVDPDFLYTIKMSHACYDIRWDKTMFDIKFMKEKGCKLIPGLYNSLRDDWGIIHPKKNIKVSGKPEEFFKQTIKRRYNHDDLHEFVKFYDKPLHESIRPDPEDVKCRKDLWDKLSYDDKLRCALEEAYVFAIERYLEYPPKIALAKSLKLLTTSSTKGWFNFFLIDNYFNLRFNKFNEQFFNIFRGIKENGQEISDF